MFLIIGLSSRPIGAMPPEGRPGLRQQRAPKILFHVPDGVLCLFRITWDERFWETRQAPGCREIALVHVGRVGKGGGPETGRAVESRTNYE